VQDDLKELYEQPHSTRERHYGLMLRGAPRPGRAGVGSQESGVKGGRSPDSAESEETNDVRNR